MRRNRHVHDVNEGGRGGERSGEYSNDAGGKRQRDGIEDDHQCKLWIREQWNCRRENQAIVTAVVVFTHEDDKDNDPNRHHWRWRLSHDNIYRIGSWRQRDADNHQRHGEPEQDGR